MYFEDAILRNMIEYAANGKTAEESDEAEFALFEKNLRDEFRNYCSVYNGLLRKEYLDIIIHLSELPLKRMEDEV